MVRVKQLTQALLNRFGYKISRNVEPHENGYPSLQLAHKALEKEAGWILQIGANDGISGDPVRPILESCERQALLIEPVPEVFPKLKENHRSFAGGIVLGNFAVGSD